MTTTQQRRAQQRREQDTPTGVAMTEYDGGAPTGRTWVASSEQEAHELSATGWRRDDPEQVAERTVPSGALGGNGGQDGGHDAEKDGASGS